MDITETIHHVLMRDAGRMQPEYGDLIMKATRLIEILEEMVNEYGDQRITFYNKAEVGQVSANCEDGDVWFRVELQEAALFECVCDSLHGSKVFKAEAPTA